MRMVLAALRLRDEAPAAATAALAPILDGSVALISCPVWRVQAFLLEAIARDALGDAGATERALERALDLAEPDGLMLPFLIHAQPDFLERHARGRTAHRSLVVEITSLLAGKTRGRAVDHVEAVSEGEMRVLRYLPTNLTKQQIADELSVSLHTIKTHTHRLYMKLGVHTRGGAVDRGRALGLLAPSTRGRAIPNPNPHLTDQAHR